MAKKKSNIGSKLIYLVFIGVVIWLWQAYSDKIKATDVDVTEIGMNDNQVVDGEGMTPADNRPLNPRLTSGEGELSVVKIPSDVNSEILTYPGFTVSFNSEYHQPNYVAWELTGEEARSQKEKRSNNFAPDLTVEGCPTLDDYRGSGFDRGHMAPSGDMKWSKDAMESCFLLTNMSPQSHELNQGSWRSLEEKCRDWAARDSAIVIVCGPVFSDSPSLTIGQTGVAVPDRYFKVVLAPFANPPRAIGFVMPNGKVPGGMQATVVSVDEVEDITGFDFFSSLPDDIEAKVESECNFPRWNRKN